MILFQSPIIDFQAIIQQALPNFKFSKSTIGDVISELLKYIFPLAGIILFVFLILGGFELLTSGGDPEKAKKAQARITSALVGFLIIFLAYWIAQLLEVIFGISIFQ